MSGGRSTSTVIVGASVGGARTARALRRAGYAGDIVLVGAETELPYDKPPLSKAVLTEGAASSIPLLTAEEAERSGIRLELGVPAVELDPDGRQVTLADGRRLDFDHLVIATGSTPRPSPWGAPPGLHVLRTLADATAIRADLLRGGDLVVIGAGFIGAEVASSATALGLDVSIVDPLPVPMERIVGAELGRAFSALHNRNGVRTHFGTGVGGIDKADGRLRVTLDDGTALDADTVVVGIGVTPRDGWLASSGLPLDNGLLCDEHLRVDGHEHIHAVGDIARWHHPRHGERVRIEHWTNAVEQASCVAHTIANPDAPRQHAPVEYVWTDQHDWKAQIVGRPWRGGEPVLIGDPDTGSRFAALWADGDGVLCGAATVNWPKVTARARKALAASARRASVQDEVAALMAS